MVRTDMQEAARHHDMTALTHGKFTGEGPRGVTVTRIVPFNKTLAVRHAKTIKKWQREYQKFVSEFPLFSQSSAFSFHDRLAYEEKVRAQCENQAQSPFIVREGFKKNTFHNGS